MTATAASRTVVNPETDHVGGGDLSVSGARTAMNFWQAFMQWMGWSQPKPVPVPVPVPVPTARDASYIKQHGLLVMSTENLVPSPAEASIYTVRADGTGKRMITGAGNWMPSWTPDGRIIFTSMRSGSPQVWTMNEDGTRPMRLDTPNLGGILQVQMARNGLIVFTADGGIWSMQKDGTNLKKIVSNSANETAAHPSLALSGTWMTYTNYEFEPVTHIPLHRQIWSINTDGTNKKQLTFIGNINYPDANASMISPDEKWIALFTGKEDQPGQTVFTTGYRNIGIMGAEGGAIRRLTDCRPIWTQQEFNARSADNAIMADNPAWSPDSQWIMHDRADKYFLHQGTWMVDIDGQHAQQLYPELRGAGRVMMKF